MWFDAKAKLAEIAGDTPATSATTATQPLPVSQLSRVSQAPVAENHSFVAEVASVATPRTEPDGQTVGGRAMTWTGKVVSLDDWRHLTAWEKHGPDGWHWCGISKAWKGEKR